MFRCLPKKGSGEEFIIFGVWSGRNETSLLRQLRDSLLLWACLTARLSLPDRWPVDAWACCLSLPERLESLSVFVSGAVLSLPERALASRTERAWAPEHIWACLRFRSVSERVWACLSLPEPAWACLSRRWACLSVPEPCACLSVLGVPGAAGVSVPSSVSAPRFLSAWACLSLPGRVAAWAVLRRALGVPEPCGSWCLSRADVPERACAVPGVPEPILRAAWGCEACLGLPAVTDLPEPFLRGHIWAGWELQQLSKKQYFHNLRFTLYTLSKNIFSIYGVQLL
jgi:hypothetical protein